MVQRITNASKYAQLIADMQTNMYNYNKITTQLSSGSKLTNITDDPIASVNALNTTRQLGQIETFEQNVKMASNELSTLDDVLALSTGYLTSAWDKAVMANNQTYGKSSLKAIKIEIDEIAKTMVDLANTEYDDNYIFSGANTKTLAYTIDDNGNIVYQGTPYDNPDYIRQTEVADGVFEVINTTGDKVFGQYVYEQEQTADGKNVFLDKDGKRVIETIDTTTGTASYAYEDATPYTGDVNDLTASMTETAEGIMGTLRLLSKSLQQVIDGLEEDDDTKIADGYALMNSTLDMFSNSMNTITNEQTKFGGVANRLEMTSSTLETNNDNLTAYLSEIKDIDYAEAVTQWMNAQYAYQASLQVSASSMNLSLLNYLS